MNSIMGIQIENPLLSNRRQILKAIGVSGQDILHDNPYLQHANKLQDDVQIDYLVQSATSTLLPLRI